MDQMRAALTDNDRMLEENAVQKAEVLTDNQRIGDEIKDVFGQYIAAITNRAAALKRKFDSDSKEQSDALDQKQEELQRVRESVEKGLEEQKGMLMDMALDSKKTRNSDGTDCKHRAELDGHGVDEVEGERHGLLPRR